MTALEIAMRDSLTLAQCKTERELHYAVRNIEARHAVEGIPPADLASWQDEKRRHATRIFRSIVA